jgi:hypothetical protein
MYEWASKTARIPLYSIDDVLSSSPGYEMLALVFQQSWAESGPPPYPTQFPSCVISSFHLVGYDISSRDSIVELWNDTLPDDRNIDLIFYDNRYIDHFFTFGDNRFCLRKSENGDIIDSSATLDQGSGRIIAYNEIEKSGDPYAIFIEDHALKLYSIDVATSVDYDKPLPLPDAFKLKKPYPNPFNTKLNIQIDVVRKGKLEVKIFNILGQEIADIFTGNVSPGELKLIWESNDAPSGIYLIQATMNSQPRVEKAVLLK